MSRQRPPEQPRWALVAWREAQVDCIRLSGLPAAIARGAMVIAKESDLLPIKARGADQQATE